MTVWQPLYATEIVRTTLVTNDSSGVIYPQWQIVGPGVYPILRNVTTGLSFQLNATILRGETVTIDFDPTQKTVSGSVQGNLKPSVVSGSSYWSLATGVNSVAVELGQTLPESKITMLRVPR